MDSARDVALHNLRYLACIVYVYNFHDDRGFSMTGKTKIAREFCFAW